MSTTDQQSKRERQKARRQAKLEEERRQQQRRRAQRRVFTGVAVVAGLAVLLLIAYLLVSDADRTLGVAEPTVAEDAVPLPPGAGEADTAIGTEAPDASGESIDGEPITVGGTGEPQVLAFMAHWCPHCQNELPRLVEYMDAGVVPDDVRMVAISTLHEPSRPNWPPDRWFRDVGWQGETLVDSTGDIQDLFGLTGTPYFVFIDGDGVVQLRLSGEIEQEQLEQGIALITGEGGDAADDAEEAATDE